MFIVEPVGVLSPGQWHWNYKNKDGKIVASSRDHYATQELCMDGLEDFLKSLRKIFEDKSVTVVCRDVIEEKCEIDF